MPSRPLSISRPPLHRLRARRLGQALLRLLLPLQAKAHAGKRLQRAIHLKGLQQIVKGIHLKRIAHILLVRRGKDDHQQRVSILQHAGAGHAVHLGHFHVQYHRIRLFPVVKRQHFLAVLRFAHQLAVLCALDDLAHHQAHACVVVRNGYPYWLHKNLRPRSQGRFSISAVTTARRSSRASRRGRCAGVVTAARGSLASGWGAGSPSCVSS